MKKIVSLVLAMSMVLSMFVSAFAATSFDDIVDTKYAGAVEALVELSVINGLPDGTYGPEKEVTRAQLAKMLVICLGLGDSVEALEGSTVFNDVAEGHWATGYINAAVQTKVIAGYPDGSFKPEKNVSYAEAVTMVIRALGYGNVVDAEGEWPTSYMLKAIELELLDDMGSPKQGEAALRGNVAILLWNMLRTPMWKITSESQGMGMTSEADALMLNVKFPDYRYVEDVYLADVTVADGEVTATVHNGLNENAQGYYAKSAKLVDVDLPRLVEGMKVSALIKDYDEEDATFLTLTPAHTIVEGAVTKAPTANKIEIDEVEYTLKNANAATTYVDEEVVEVNDYVVMEVDGKKVVTTTVGEGDEAVAVANLAVLPTEAVEVERIKAMEKDIAEDDLVIIDGVWATREEVEEGDVYTALTTVNGSKYFAVSTVREEGTFESLTYEDDGDEVSFVEVDGEEYRIIIESLDDVIAYEGEENDLDVTAEQLLEKAADNKYLDNDVELVLNYLGQVIRMNFGEVSDLAAEGNFFAVKSNGAWPISTEDGKVYTIKLVGLDGEEDNYTIAANVDLTDVEEDSIYALDNGENGVPVFVYVKFNDKDEIKEIVRVSEDIEDPKYSIVAITEEMLLDDGKMGEYRITDSTVVLTSTPLLEDEGEEDERVVGFEVESTEGEAELKGVTEGFIIYETDSITNRAKFVLVPQEAKSQDLLFGKLTARRNSANGVFATIEGTEYKVDLEKYDDNMSSAYAALRDMLETVVAYTENDGKISIEASYTNAILEGAPYVVKTEETSVEFSEEIVVSDELTLEEIVDMSDEDLQKDLEDYTFVELSAVEGGEEDEFQIELDYVDNLGEGVANVSLRKGDRIYVDGEVVLIIKGLKATDVVEGGVIVAPAEEETTYTFKVVVAYDEALTPDEKTAAAEELTLPEASEVEKAEGEAIEIPAAETKTTYKTTVVVEGAEVDATVMPAAAVTVTVTVSKV